VAPGSEPVTSLVFRLFSYALPLSLDLCPDWRLSKDGFTQKFKQFIVAAFSCLFNLLLLPTFAA